MLGGELPNDAGKLSRGLLERRSGRAARDRLQPAVVPVIPDGWHQWDPHVDAVRILEPAQHHANDAVRYPIELERLPDDARVATEMTLPQAVTDDGNPRVASGRVLLLSER